jgi:predicted N-formylglutamate amidohydrolase
VRAVVERSPSSLDASLAPRLLAPDELPSFRVERPDGASPFVFTADHASRRLPRALGTLGLSDADTLRHIAWDIGVEQLALHLSERLDAFTIMQGYSRLAIDVNRPPGSPESIATASEGTPIPGNIGLSELDVSLRARELFEPYHARIREELDRRATLARPAVLVALHSFTPAFLKVARPWHAGVLYHRDARLGQALLARLRAQPGLVVGDNEPYSVSDETDYGVPTHGERRGLAHVEIEIRQDLLADAQGVERWATLLAATLAEAYAAVAAYYSAP